MSLLFALLVTLATAPNEPPAEGVTPSHDDAEGRLGDLYLRASADFAAADYAAAIEGFAEGARESARLGQDAMRHDFVVALATAHGRAYGVDRDPAHLRQAGDLLERVLGPDGEGADPATLDKAREALAEIDAQLAEVEAAQAEQAERDSAAAAARQAPDAQPSPSPALADTDADTFTASARAGLAAAGTGIALTGGGLAMLLHGQVGVERAAKRDPDYIAAIEANGELAPNQRAYLDRQIRTWTIAGAVTGAVGVAAIVTGSVLFARSRHTRDMALLPTLSTERIGLVLHGRF